MGAAKVMPPLSALVHVVLGLVQRVADELDDIIDNSFIFLSVFYRYRSDAYHFPGFIFLSIHYIDLRLIYFF